MKSNNQETKGKVLLGKIVGAQGIRGEVKVYSFGDAPSDFNKYEKALLVMPGDEEYETVPYTIEKARVQGNLAVVKFSEVSDRNAAEDLRNAEVYVASEDLEELPEDTYYVRDLEGLRVIDDDTDEEVGTISEVIQNAAQDIYRVVLDSSDGETDASGAHKPDASDAEEAIAREEIRETLIPAVKEFIKKVDVESGTIRIHFIEGMR